jgi:hypothetical protein
MAAMLGVAACEDWGRKQTVRFWDELARKVPFRWCPPILAATTLLAVALKQTLDWRRCLGTIPAAIRSYQSDIIRVAEGG